MASRGVECIEPARATSEFFSVVEGNLEILNPTSHEKLMLLADYCGLRDGDRVLDVGSGKGYMLREWAKRWEIEGTGLEINPYSVAQARVAVSNEGMDERLTFVESDAKDFAPEPESYDVVACIGASFAIGFLEEAVQWMLGALRPSGVLATGEVFLHAPLAEVVAEAWKNTAPPEGGRHRRLPYPRRESCRSRRGRARPRWHDSCLPR